MAKPVVNGIEKDLKGKAEVVRLDLLSAVGREAAARYGIRGVPAILVLAGNGDPVYRQSGMPDRGEVVRAAIEHH